MIKFNRSQSNDIFALKQKNLKKVSKASISRVNSEDSGISSISNSSSNYTTTSCTTSSFSSYICTASESEIMILNLRTLVEDENLEKWLEGLESKGLKHQVDTKVMRNLIKEFFEKSGPSTDSKSKSKSPSTSTSLESLQSKGSTSSSEDMQMKIESLKLKKDVEKIQKDILGKNGNQLQSPQVNLSTMPHRLMVQFKELSRPKQVLVVLGITIIVASVGFLSWSLIGLMWPKLLALNHTGYAREVMTELLKQRQEPSFHLLMHHAENAKPLSYNWANQYILWKYLI